MLKYAWLAGLVGVVPVLTGMPTAQAAQIYNVTVQEANCGGSASNCSAGGNGSTFSGAPITFQWQSNLASGGLNFNLQAGGTNTIQGFLNTGTGQIVAGSLTTQTGFSLDDLLSASGFGQSTQFIFNVSNIVAANSGSITHDAGISIEVAGTPITPDADRTLATTTAFSITADLIGESANLFFVATNNLPEVLNSPNFSGAASAAETPLPAAAWLFGGGLGGLGMLLRRQRKAAV